MMPQLILAPLMCQKAALVMEANYAVRQHINQKSNMIETICSIAVSLAAFILSVTSLFISSYERKKLKRIEPTISIWDNKEDNIETRIKKGNSRIFVDEEEIDSLDKKQYAYVCVNNYFDYKMIDCEITFSCISKAWNVGIILPGKYVIIPVLMNKTNDFVCTIDYRTEENEFMKYEMTIKFPEMTDRKDIVYIKKNRKYKKLSRHNIQLSNSISKDELLDKVPNLNYYDNK